MQKDNGCTWILAIVIGLFGYWSFNQIRGKGGCDAYASDYSCWYLKGWAHYDVYYWHNVSDDDPEDEKLIAAATGIQQCRSKAIEYAARIREPWNERSYICVLMDDGHAMEKHRLIEE